MGRKRSIRLSTLSLILKDQHKAVTLLNHFGSITNLARASVQDLSAFLSRDKAAHLISSLCLAAVALREERTRLLIDTPLAVAELCAEMRFLSHKSLRVILLNPKQELIKVVFCKPGNAQRSAGAIARLQLALKIRNGCLPLPHVTGH
jgi:DNA repair protein RadC